MLEAYGKLPRSQAPWVQLVDLRVQSPPGSSAFVKPAAVRVLFPRALRYHGGPI